ncbi:uncharacterized protein EV420DRAFT_1252861, partial [Desarmillaria tabescens]
VPVPLGASIPRRDKEEVYPCYCRLMLILFKPWTSASDLQNAGESWSDAFERFHTICARNVLSVINNMQIMHECHDSHD